MIPKARKKFIKNKTMHPNEAVRREIIRQKPIKPKYANT